MVSVLNAGKSLRNTLNYNEQKIKQGKAILIHAEGFGKDKDDLRFKDKLGHLQKLAQRNERTSVKSIHISLNFDPSEHIHPDTLRKIAATYIEKIGFGGQPYLVYQHHDAGHPHIHIVTTNIRPDGTRIKLHNIGRNQSEKARRQIENDFNLVKADSRQRQKVYQLKPVDIQKVQYGRSQTKRAITTVLDHILPLYKYSSIAELNAVLKSYNIVADQGKKDSRIAKANGLVYRILNERGEKVGVPIKASDLYSQPTMKNLQIRFAANEEAKQRNKTRVKNAIDLVILRRQAATMPDLEKVLQQQSIQLVIRQNKDGVIYGLTYVDHKTKCVFNGSDLGKPYSANQVKDRLSQPAQQQATQLPPPPGQAHLDTRPVQPNTPSHHGQDLTPGPDNGLAKEIMGELMDTGHATGPAAELREEQKRKRKRKLRL